MAATLTIRDQTATGDTVHSFPLEFPTERISVRDLIRERVYQEVQDFNRKRNEQHFHGLVQPTGAEQILNPKTRAMGFRLPAHREIDWKKQFEKATEAFERNGFFILIDEKQAESLDQEFVIGHGTDVSFVRLVQLVGG